MNYPPFDDAVSSFEAFLRECGVPSDIRWVAFPDVAFVGARLYVRSQPQEVAFAAASTKYERAISRQLGVRLSALGRAGMLTFCYVYRPSSRIEAEYHNMPDGLKLSVRNDLPEATVIANDGAWERIREQD